MKQGVAAMIAFTLIVLCSCDKNKNTDVVPPTAEHEWGVDSGSCVFNDSIAWKPNSLRLTQINDTIIKLRLDINRQLSNGEIYPYESVLFGMLRKTMSLQRLDSTGFVPANVITKPNSFFFTKVQYDVLNETFEVYQPDSANNWIQITEQQNDYKEIKGIFNLTLIKTDDGSDYLYPDTIRIRNGYFRVTFKE